MSWPTQQGVYAAGDVALQSGATLRDARLSWKAHGRLTAARDNVIVYPTSYAARHPDLEWLIGPAGILDPDHWFIVICDMFGNGMSSSPSNTPDYPTLVTPCDNVVVQRRALQELFGVERVACVYGWSMGAIQAYHWAALFPDAVARIVVNCGVARTAVHNQVFLRGLMATLEAAPEHIGDGRYAAEPRAALRAFGRIYAGWALSQDFYRAGLHLASGPAGNLGAADLESFLHRDWEQRFGARPAADLYAQLKTWDAADISANALYEGDLARALKAIAADVLLMPGATDLYFRVADNEAELPLLKRATLRPIPSIWGHRAGNPTANPADAAFIRDAVRTLLAPIAVRAGVPVRAGPSENGHNQPAYLHHGDLAMSSAENAKLKRVLREKALPPGAQTPLAQRRALMEKVAFRVAEDIAVETIEAAGRAAEWLRAPGSDAARVLLYLHGGGYTLGSINTHRALAGELSRAAACAVLLIDYRLAPEAPYPAAVDDAVAAYQWLLDQGHAPVRLAVAGDSAGGGLTAATLIALRERGLSQPRAAVCISPWSDLCCSNASYQTRAAADPMIAPADVAWMAGLYLQGADPKSAFASPNRADLRGLPPLLIHVGRDEVLLDDAIVLHEAARSAGVASTLEIWDDMIHVWHAFHPMLPEGRDAIARIGAYLREQWTAA